MSAQTANVTRPWRPADTVRVPLQGAATVYQGAVVEADADGRIAPATAGTGRRYLGVALAHADNAAGVAGAVSVDVRRTGAVRLATVSGAAPALGDLAYLADDQTVANDPDGATPLGRVVESDDDAVWVALGGGATPRVLVVDAALDFASVAAGATATLTATVAGAAPGDLAVVTPPTEVAGVTWEARVSAADTVAVSAKNFTASAIDPASGTFRIAVIGGA